MEVLSRTEGHVPNLAIVQKTLKPSQESVDDQESKISELIYKLDEKLSDADSEQEKVVLFDTIASQEGYFVRTMNLIENSPTVPSSFQSKFSQDKILKLAFREDAMVGDLVDAPIKDKDRYVIAILSSIKEKGEPKFEDVEPMIKRDYIEERKTKLITDEMTGASSLEALSKKLKGAPVTKATVTFANPQITGSTFEPEVVGALYSGLKDGESTKPIKGKVGVYVIRLEKTIKPPVAANYLMEKNQLLSGQKGNIQGTAKKALVKLADVVDNRSLFNAGIRR
jgi:peptidyl-prolyl cis-trans isomerase D